MTDQHPSHDRITRLVRAAAAERVPEPVDLWPSVLAGLRGRPRNRSAAGLLTLAAALGIVFLAVAVAYVALTGDEENPIRTASLNQGDSADLLAAQAASATSTPLPVTELTPSPVNSGGEASGTATPFPMIEIAPSLVPAGEEPIGQPVTATPSPVLVPSVLATPVPVMQDAGIVPFEFAYDPVLEVAFPHPAGWTGYHPAILQRPDLSVRGVVFFASIDDLGGVDPQYDPGKLPEHGPTVIVLRTVNPLLSSAMPQTSAELMAALTDGAFPSEDTDHVYLMTADAEMAGWSLTYWLVVPEVQDIYATADRILYPMRERIWFPAESRLEPGAATRIQFDGTIGIHRLVYPAADTPVEVEITVAGQAEAGVVRGTFGLYDASGMLAEFDAAKVEHLTVRITPRQVDEQGMAQVVLFSPDDFRFAANGQTTLEVTLHGGEQAAANTTVPEERVEVAVPLDPEQNGSVAFGLKPGDEVAAIITVLFVPADEDAQFQAPLTAGEADVTLKVIEHLTVIEVGGEGLETSATAPQPLVVTLGASPQDATTLSWAVEAGLPISLVLTHPAD